VWVEKNKQLLKIASIGIRVRKWIAYHGFSINVSNDLNKFNGIIPCGITGKKMTSLKDLRIKNFSNINEVVAKKFLNIFL